MATLKEIAKELNISIATVSYVYNNKWQEKKIRKHVADKVKSKLQEKHYRPNMLGFQLRTKKTQTIGIILADLTRRLSLDIFAGIENKLAHTEYSALVCNSDIGRHEEKHLQVLASRNVEGIIFCPQRNLQGTNLIKEIAGHDIPIVMVDNYFPNADEDFVVTDNYWGAYQITEFLIRQSGKKITYIGSEKRLSATRDRFAGFCQCLKDNNIPLSEELFRKIRNPDDIPSLLKDIVAYKPPPALFLESFLYFKSGFRFLAEQKMRVPQDIALAGFDPVDLTIADMQELSLPTVVQEPIPFAEQNAFLIGQLSAEILLKRISKQKTDKAKIFLKPTLRFFHHQEKK